ncbi:MAG: DUF3598 family protein [Spirulinaceae cyanobacterium RM2_2_10]|nr:DUF3598 family protein [Spirulinaceae cyanobacterium SM2_1_0]NJO21378.1 DUF3598 family protein [Spirulinaceae cyanobacterium RM2_2_10]
MNAWHCLLKNLGEWQGSFTRFSPQGELLADEPSCVTLASRDRDREICQTIRRHPPGQSPQEQVLVYRSLARSVLFHDDGSFSQGSMQWGPFSEFGAELGLLATDERLRLVQLYDRDSQLSELTLIREHRAGTPPPTRPSLSVEPLLGTWQGEAITRFANLNPPERFATRLHIARCGRDRLSQTLQFGDRQLQSTARIEGQRLHFDTNALPVQILLLPNGASSNCPSQIQAGHSFVLELGWLLTPECRLRLVRRYGSRGDWQSLTHIVEHKV